MALYPGGNHNDSDPYFSAGDSGSMDNGQLTPKIKNAAK